MTPSTTDHTRLSHDLFYVLTQAGFNHAVSLFHAGRNFGDGKSYRVIKQTEVVFPCVLGMDLDVNRDFKVEIYVIAHHMPGVEDQLFQGGLTAAEKIALVEQRLEGKPLH